METVTRDRQSTRQTDWAESDLAIIFTALLMGIRAAELRNADIGDIRTTQQGEGVIRVRGKGQKDRSIPIEAGPGHGDRRVPREPCQLLSPSVVSVHGKPWTGGLARQCATLRRP